MELIRIRPLIIFTEAMRKKLLKAWSWWKGIAQRAVEFQAKIFLRILYFTFLMPVGFWFRNTHDVFRQKKIRSNWQDWPHQNVIQDMKKM